jgi:uncharacterized integral membrane protein
MSFVKLGLGIVVVVLVVLFAISNSEPVKLNLLFGEFGPVPLSVFVILAVAFGAAVCAGTLGWTVASARMQTRRDAKRIAELEQEVHGLRTLPMVEEAKPDTLTPRDA